jgi:redox-sensing transcriptional repressor
LKKDLRPDIPRKAIYRLSVYLRCLQRLKANGIRTVSSEALAKVAGVKSTQLRKDLAYFGQFGTRGLGYDVGQLAGMTSDLLGTNSLQPVILVGVGNLGLALLSYRGFEQEGFEIVAAFDIDPHRVRGKTFPCRCTAWKNWGKSLPERHVKMAMIAVPAAAAQEAANTLVQAFHHRHPQLRSARPARPRGCHGQQRQPGHRTGKPQLLRATANPNPSRGLFVHFFLTSFSRTSKILGQFFPGDKQPVPRRVVGNAVEHIGVVRT